MFGPDLVCEMKSSDLVCEMKSSDLVCHLVCTMQLTFVNYMLKIVFSAVLILSKVDLC